MVGVHVATQLNEKQAISDVWGLQTWNQET